MKSQLLVFLFILFCSKPLPIVLGAQYGNEEEIQEAVPNEEVDFADDYVQPRHIPSKNYLLTRECVHSYSKAGSLIFDGRERHIFVNSNKLLGTCPCESQFTQSIFTARHPDPMEKEDIEVRAECPNMRRFCMCTESGQCYTTSGNVDSVGFTPFCDGGGCHMYAIVNGASSSGLRGNEANFFRVSDQLQEDGSPRRPSSDSVYLKARSVSCNGCSTIQSTTCTGPFKDTTLNYV